MFIHSNCSDGKHSSNSPRDVIEVLKSFNFEFIMITREKTYFEKMQQNVQMLFPEYKQNQYLNLQEFAGLKRVLQSLDKRYTQEELADYCKQVVRIMGH